jgi:hypothetical protein
MDIKKSLDKVFSLISTIPVSGDNVEVMCLAKQELKTIYKELSSAEKDDVQVVDE